MSVVLPDGEPSAGHVPAGCELLVVEGAGAARREATHLVDVVVWVQIIG